MGYHEETNSVAFHVEESTHCVLLSRMRRVELALGTLKTALGQEALITKKTPGSEDYSSSRIKV
jgi:hypothetical protein